MWSKLYLAVLALSLAAMGFFTFYSWSWLQSKGNPADAVAAYQYHSGLSWTVLLLSAAALLILGNAVLWAGGRAWAMWLTFLYFASFVVTTYFWLGEAFFHFKKDRGLFDGSFSVGPIFAVILIAIAAIFVFLDQFLIVRLNKKMYPPTEEIALPATAEPVGE